MNQYLIFLTISFLPLIASCGDPQLVKVTVVSEDGKRIEAAEVNVRFFGAKNPAEVKQNGRTNKEGVFAAKGKARLSVFVYATKEGYYRTTSDDLSTSKDHDLTLTIREKKNPIPLYAKGVQTVLPQIGGVFGFDLKKGDWVKPHGNGNRTDLMFHAADLKNAKGEWGGELKISFPEEGEGIVFIKNGYLLKSEMVMPHMAPQSGYQNHYTRKEFGYQNENKERDGSFFLRTRRQTRPDGSVQYNYTKIYNGFFFLMGGGKFSEERYREISKDEKASLRFAYAFNPTHNDRNLEFDPSKNLMKNLNSREKVRSP